MKYVFILVNSNMRKLIFRLLNIINIHTYKHDFYNLIRH